MRCRRRTLCAHCYKRCLPCLLAAWVAAGRGLGERPSCLPLSHQTSTMMGAGQGSGWCQRTATRRVGTCGPVLAPNPAPPPSLCPGATRHVPARLPAAAAGERGQAAAGGLRGRRQASTGRGKRSSVLGLEGRWLPGVAGCPALDGQLLCLRPCRTKSTWRARQMWRKRRGGGAAGAAGAAGALPPRTCQAGPAAHRPGACRRCGASCRGMAH